MNKVKIQMQKYEADCTALRTELHSRLNLWGKNFGSVKDRPSEPLLFSDMKSEALLLLLGVSIRDSLLFHVLWVKLPF